MVKRVAGFMLFRRNCDQIEYLLLCAPKKDYPWSSPKGRIDKGEDEFSAALRETKEETGYTESDLIIHSDKSLTINYLGKKKPKSVSYWLAELRNPNKAPVLSREHSEFKWLNKEAAKMYVGLPIIQDTIDKFHCMILELN